MPLALTPMARVTLAVTPSGAFAAAAYTCPVRDVLSFEGTAMVCPASKVRFLTASPSTRQTLLLKPFAQLGIAEPSSRTVCCDGEVLVMKAYAV